MPGSTLVNSSIVFVVENNSPGMYSKDYLMEKGVFPKDWEVEQSVNIPPLSHVVFSNGHVFQSNENRTKLELNYPKAVDLKGTESPPDTLSDAAQVLARETSYLAHRAIGINFRVFIEDGSFKNLVDGLPQNSKPTEVDYVVEYEPFQVKMTLRGARRDKDDTHGIQIDANFHGEVNHHEDSENRLDEIESKLDLRTACLNRLKELINETNI